VLLAGETHQLHQAVACRCVRCGSDRTGRDSSPVPAPLTMHMAKVYEMLADGQWHDREPVVRAAATAVLPGPAKRNMLAADERERRRRLSDERRPDRVGHDDRSLIRRGQRRVALLGITRSQRIDKKINDDGVWQI
jgi:hypothetical protein